jgi:predicted ATP-grasp superfamily ATP-dependent carboligase
MLASRGVLFPASDAFVAFVSEFRDDLSQFFDFVLPPKEIVKAMLDKRQQYELASSAGLDVPATFAGDDLSAIASTEVGISFPLFVKPVTSHLWRESYDSKGSVVRSRSELIQTLQTVRSRGLEVLIQEIVPGPVSNNFEVSVYVDREGRVCAGFEVQKWRQYPPRFGVGTLVESVRRPDLRKLAYQLCEKTGIKGYANIEFKIDERDQRPKYIETNIRLWQQHALATYCGIDFPYLQYADVTGQKIPLNDQYLVGPQWWDPLSDFQTFVEYSKARQMSVREWLSSLKRIKSFGVFALDDPMPGLAALQFGLRLLKLPAYLLRSQRLPTIFNTGHDV